MRFIVDAQLPKKISSFLNYKGYDSLHTLDLPNSNKTKDSELNTISLEEKRVVISKNRDFIESLVISNKPYKLLYINTGNITNSKFQELLSKNLEKIIEFLSNNRFVELTSENIIIHD